MTEIVRTTTHEFKQDNRRALVDVCTDAHGSIVAVRLKAQIPDPNPTYTPRWSPPWEHVGSEFVTHYDRPGRTYEDAWGPV